MKERNEGILIKASFFVFLLCACLLVASLFVRQRELRVRAEAIADASEKNAAISETVEGEIIEGMSGGLLLSLRHTDSMYVCVPLPENVTSSGITAENHYMDGQLWLRMPDTDFLFYSGKSVTGDVGRVRQAAVFQEENQTVLRLALDNIYEYDLISEDQNLYIQLMSPRERYERVIVVDPASETGGDVTLAVSEMVAELGGGSNVRIYQTRRTLEPCPQEKAAALANAVKADMLIRISVEENDDSGEYGTLARYSDDYFIPGFSSIDLADVLERKVVTQLRSETRGIERAGDRDIAIRKAKVPAAEIVLGFMSNAQENKLLLREDYQRKAAQGIFDAINAAYEAKGKK